MMLRTPCKPLLVLGLSAMIMLAGSSDATAGGFPAENVTLLRWFDVSEFGAVSGNDCWGYTSSSGREYALAGLDNQVAFIEITDPANPVWFASVGHPSNLWGDMKVYQDHAYLVTEGSSGIQVVDLTDIDNHVVTEVRTISPPSHSHNVAVDTVSGYLYTTDGYMFDLSDPANPVQIGRWNADWQHDIQAVTYTSGLNAGRQIIFGAATGAGLDIIDVTDKFNTFLVSRTSYPNVDYCHQVWTEDLNYIYINDELDGIQRTTVIDISDLANPVVMGDYNNGTTSTDHNNYVRDGFVYEADYHAGLRIFDANTDPVQPPQVGWFDTYPPNDQEGFDGAWGVYPFFPSGTVIVSDITRGLFILDVSEALGAVVLEPQDLTIVRGRWVSGKLADMFRSDNARMVFQPGITQGPEEPPVWLILEGQSPTDSPTELSFILETRVDTPGVTQRIELFNYDTGEFEEVDSRTASFNEDNVVEVTLEGDLSRFVDAKSGAIQAQLTWMPPPLVILFPWNVGIDQAVWTIAP